MPARARRVLVVEDDIDAREAMTAFLEGEGYQVVGAANGREALDQLATSPIFCVVLLDLGKPVMDGWEFWVQQVREPAMEFTPVVIISLEGFLARHTRALEALPAQPAEWGHLLEAVQHHC